MVKSGLFALLLTAFGAVVVPTAMAASAPNAEPIPAPQPTVSPEILARAPRFVGTASCTAAGCHAGEYRSRPSHGDPWSPVAYNLWLSNDRHARAYETLLSAESQEIAAKLGLAAAHQQPECLACHAPEGATDHFTVSHRSTVVDGVGCEACHGAAENWLAPHKTDGWRFSSSEAKASLGFRDLDNLATRAVACAECHVGSAGREVNHDLIAAGHPRLTFELSSLHARMAKHWRNEDQPQETLEAKLWVVGRGSGAQATVQLLKSRAVHGKVWPEFSEYDCYACHHSLRDAGPADPGGLAAGDPRPGGLHWSEGSFEMLDILGLDFDSVQRVKSLASEMSRPLPDRQRVARLSGEIEQVLGRSAARASHESLTTTDVQQYLRRLSSDSASGASRWDRASQRFLGLAAMHFSSVALAGRSHSLPGSAAAARRQHLEHLRSLLQFPNARDGSVTNSPPSWDDQRRTEVEQSLQRVRSTLP
ncbi:MAG: hypothetical protein KDA37_06475 [Planctomycetales bacterium]|nr:hypothetical protein [Planctomycetales bacterium]